MIRLATPADIPALTSLIEVSVRGLLARNYDPQQVESSLRYLFGVDTRIVEDGTYYVVEADGVLAGGGGWSKRLTPFGGDQAATQDAGLRDPAVDPAVIRAFFIHPDWARRGIARRLLAHCEEAAKDAGFKCFELVATLTGVPFYTALGFREVEPIEIRLPDGVALGAVKMIKP
jgi:N-acetylglutamate synthase-like GNAT family acetyltransferase